MTAQVERRVSALEARDGGRPRLLLVVVRVVSPGNPDAEPAGINAAPPHFPASVDRLPGEAWGAFTARLEGRLSHLPAGTVVRVATCNALPLLPAVRTATPSPAAAPAAGPGFIAPLTPKTLAPKAMNFTRRACIQRAQLSPQRPLRLQSS